MQMQESFNFIFRGFVRSVFMLFVRLQPLPTKIRLIEIMILEVLKSTSNS